MDADARRAQEIFGGDHRYLVPAYQRPYVWEEDTQWRPLWEDIERLADARLDNKNDSHFLGTIVLKQEKTAPGGLSEWTVIDGQQRLTSLQIILSALAFAAREDGDEKTAIRSRSAILHEEYKAEGEERFRFWPTTINQNSYRNIMQETGPDPSQNDTENTVEEAWSFFYERIKDYTARDTDEFNLEYLMEENDPEKIIALRYGAIYDALLGMIEIVAIQINDEEKPQVVFETLNARGTPLLATDLIKNALLEKAAGEGLDIDEIHDAYWRPGLGDHSYWSKEESLANYTAPKSEIFFLQWLSMKTGKPASAEAVFDRFRKTFIDAADAPPVEELMEELMEDANLLRGIESLSTETPEGLLAQRMRLLNINAFRPLFLLLLKLNLDNETKENVFGALESFLLRRAIIRLQASGYNQLNSDILTALYRASQRAQEKEEGKSQDNVRSSQEILEAIKGLKVDEIVITRLLSSQASSGRWPTDTEITPVLTEQEIYGTLGRNRIFDLLSELEVTRRRERQSEGITALPERLHIEHIMPQSWGANWPLDDPSDKDAQERREDHIHLLGNLTLISGTLNISLSNSEWDHKRSQLNQNSILLLNKDIEREDVWNEEKIVARGQQLTQEILKRWRGPEYYLPSDWSEPDAEIDPESVEKDPDTLAEIYASAPEKLRTLLLNLSNNPDKRRTYQEIEQDLQWNRGSIAKVFGAYSRHNQGSKRPFRITLNPGGAWVMWMDTNIATAIQATHSEYFNKTKEETEARIEDPAVKDLLLSLDDILTQYPHLTYKYRGDGIAVQKQGRLVFNGYFAKKWLFLWIYNDADYKSKNLEETLKNTLSKPEEVKRNKGGSRRIRLHITSADEFKSLLNLL